MDRMDLLILRSCVARAKDQQKMWRSDLSICTCIDAVWRAGLAYDPVSAMLCLSCSYDSNIVVYVLWRTLESY